MNNWQTKIDELKKEIEQERIKGGIIKPKGRPRKEDIRYSDEQFIHLDGRKGFACFNILIAQAKLTQLQEDKTFYDTELKSFAEEIKDFLRGNDGFMYPIDVDKLLSERLGKSDEELSYIQECEEGRI
jgi:hypothetical protein